MSGEAALAQSLPMQPMPRLWLLPYVAGNQRAAVAVVPATMHFTTFIAQAAQPALHF